jgi:hypothetical protein
MGPWSLPESPGKNAQNQLVDVLSHVPGFLQDQADVFSTGDRQLQRTLICKIERQLSITYSWRWDWEGKHPNAAHEVDHLRDYPLLGLLNSRPFTKVLVCSSWQQATEISLYNSVVLCLLGILWSLQSPAVIAEATQTKRDSSSPLLLPNQITSLEQVAVEICRVFEYQLATVSTAPPLRSRDDEHIATLMTSPETPLTASRRAALCSAAFWLWTRLWPLFPAHLF